MRFMLLIAAIAMSFGSSAQDLPETPNSETGYPSPDAALAALQEKPGVTSREENDWIVISDSEEKTIWSIASKQHTAYPTAVKRSFVEEDGFLKLVMKVQCGATKSICDQVVRAFQDVNNKMRSSFGQ